MEPPDPPRPAPIPPVEPVPPTEPVPPGEPPPGEPPPGLGGLLPGAAPDTSSLAAGVVIGLFGVPLGLLVAGYLLSFPLSLLGNDVRVNVWPLFSLVALVVAIGAFVGVPVRLFGQGRRRMGQGVLIGYGVLALVFGVCTALLLSSLSNMH